MLDVPLRMLLAGAYAASATLGQAHCARALEELMTRPGAQDPDGVGEVVVLDFDGVELATPSYLKFTVLELIRLGALSAKREGGLNVFAVVSNANDEVVDAINTVMVANGAQVLVQQARAGDRLVSARMLGNLDPALTDALAAVLAHPNSTAPMLQKVTRSGITPNAWNNRLSDLFVRRLLMRRKEGRQNFFLPLAERISPSEGQDG